MWDLELIDCFKIERGVDEKNYDAFSKKIVGGQRKLLWHGSRSSNYGGILSRGLRIAPPEAPVSGVSFVVGLVDVGPD
jgi:poly [ADP-ribose] polymerase